MNSADIKEDLRKAIETLRNGGVILYPTDTIWGLGCDASNTEAVGKIYDIKRRADAKSMLSLVGSEDQLSLFVRNIPEAACQLIEAAVNPLTIIYDQPLGIAPNLLAADGSAGFRITRENFSRQLCLGLRRPVVSTSANISGNKAPLCFSDIDPEILEAADYVCLSGRESSGKSASNIIKVSDSGIIKIIR